MEHALRPNEQVEEFYVLTWESPKEMIFEMPVRPSAERREHLSRRDFFFSLRSRLGAESRRPAEQYVTQRGPIRHAFTASRGNPRLETSRGFESVCCLYSKRSIGRPPTRVAVAAFKFFYASSNRRRRPADTSLVYTTLVFPETDRRRGDHAQGSQPA